MSFTRRELLWMPAAAPLASLAAPKAAKLNVLLIAVDDLNNRIACYGDPVVKTPNLDRLARRGVRFDRAYCNYPLCNPTRTSLLSGAGRKPPASSTTTRPRALTSATFSSCPSTYKAQGYFTARVGKIAHGSYEHQLKWDISESVAGIPLGQRGRAAPRRGRNAQGQGRQPPGRREALLDAHQPQRRAGARRRHRAPHRPVDRAEQEQALLHRLRLP